MVSNAYHPGTWSTVPKGSVRFHSDVPWAVMQLTLALLTAILFVPFSFAAVIARPAAAATVAESFTVASFVQQDIDGNGKPDEAEIHCRCYSTDDRITVIDGAGNMAPATTIEAGTDMEDDLWLFDVGNHGRYPIAVQFARQDEQLTAQIYQDQDGDGSVAIGERDGHTVVTEPGFPSITMNARDGFWQRDGRLAPNFDITVDDRMLATFAGERYQTLVQNDGKPDVVIRVRGPHDGDPRSYDWRNVYAPVPSDWGIYRTTLMVRERGEEPAFPPVFPWYVLGGTYGTIQHYEGGTVPTTPLAGVGGSPYGIVKPYGESFPPIQVDWNAGKIAYVGEFVASRGSDTNWFTYSIKRVEPGKVTEPDFESPFAYYDLAADNDSVPELSVRAERIVADDPFVPPQWRGRTYQQIRYSWEQREGQGWSYKLGLLGRNPIDGQVPFPEFALRTIPYEQFPTWVTTHAWDIATFTAVERDLYDSTEGVYAWDPSGALRDQYYAGAGSQPANAFESIDSGVRGEYSFHSGTQPYLYFSPVDARLHLAGASQGLYNVDGNRRVVYQSLAGNGFIDSWQVFDGDQAVAQLAQRPGALLYAGDGRVTLLEADVPTETFRTLPPTNHDEWVRLGQQLDANKRDFAGDDLGAMFDQFSGRRLTLSGGALSDLRETDNGFRFILDLQPGFNLGNFPVFGITEPGRYVLDYDSATGRFTAQPSSPPALSIEAVEAAAPATALEPVRVSITLANRGLEDARTVPVIVTATRSGNSPRAIAQQTVELLGPEQKVVPVSWTPPVPGDWTVTARLYPPGGAVEQSAEVTVAAAAMPPWQSVATVGWPKTLPLAYIVALLGLIALPAGGGLLLLRRQA